MNVDDLELILKQPEDKPPYMGILFKSSFNASRVNQDWISRYNDCFFQLKIELQKGFLMVTISTVGLNSHYTYLIHKFNAEQIQKFLSEIKDLEYINFGHVIREKDALIAVRTSYKGAVWVLKVDKVEFLQEY